MAIYLSRKKGGAVATPITPSNSSPAQMTANTPVNPTANGYAIASYNTKTPSNSSPVALESGEIDKIGGNGYAIQSYDMITPSSTPTSVSSGDIVKIGGSGVIVNSIPTPTSITPSNSSPVALTANTPVEPTASGYAIESYSNVNLADSLPPVPLSYDGIYKLLANGYAVATLHNVSPSNSSPTAFQMFNGAYYPTSGGYIIKEYDSVTPSSTQVSVSEGDIVKIGGNGVIVDSVPVPTNIAPSNSSPVSLSNGGLYKTGASGYAISSYSSKTPSDSSPASVSSGAIIKASASGYLYSSSGLLKGNITLITAGYDTGSSNYYTYTFSQAITTCLVVSFGDSGYSPMTYTGTGTVTNISTSTANPYFNSMKIKNVKSGDTIKIGKITISGNTRKMYAIFSIT